MCFVVLVLDLFFLSDHQFVDEMMLTTSFQFPIFCSASLLTVVSYLKSHILETCATFILNNLLQTTRIASFLAINDNFLIKSTVRCSHGFFSILLTSTSLLVPLFYFILWYKSQLSIYFPISLGTPSHQ